jgi:NAD(P)H-dependent FMN reductase
MGLPSLHVVICSTRPGRIGPLVADWILGYAQTHGAFEPTLVDLAAFKLPLLDEPNHPRMRQYQQAHTKAWSRSVSAADAFVFVTPEYNYGPPPALLNALDFLYLEWNYKPAGFVSYGGVSGGMRASARAGMTVSTLKMMPIPDSVALPNVFGQLKDGKFIANDLNIAGARAMLDELCKWEEALRDLRGRHRADALA